MPEASLAEADEGVVAGQHVDAVEHERDVVELQVLDPPPAQLEELLGDHVEVGDRDDVDVGRLGGGLLGRVLLRRLVGLGGGAALEPGGQGVGLPGGEVAPIGVDARHPHEALLGGVAPRERARPSRWSSGAA